MVHLNESPNRAGLLIQASDLKRGQVWSSAANSACLAAEEAECR